MRVIEAVEIGSLRVGGCGDGISAVGRKEQEASSNTRTRSVPRRTNLLYKHGLLSEVIFWA